MFESDGCLKEYKKFRRNHAASNENAIRCKISMIKQPREIR